MRTAAFLYGFLAVAVFCQGHAHAELVVPHLVSHWMFDETFGSFAHDSSPSGMNGRHPGGPFWGWTAGQFDNSVNFTRAANDYFEVEYSTAALELAGEKTFSFWTRLPAAPSGSNGFVSIGKDIDNRWYIDDDNGKGRIRMWQVGGGATSGAQFQTGEGVLTYGDNLWHHVVVTDTGSGAGGTQVYVDGALRGTFDSFNYSGLADDSKLRLGCRFVSAPEPMEGGLDDFVLSDTAFTATHVRAVYSLGSTEGLEYSFHKVRLAA